MGSNHRSQVGETLAVGVETCPGSGEHREDGTSSQAQREGGTSSQAQRRRGTNLGTQIPENSDKRKNIHVVRNRFIETDVSRVLTSDIKGVISDAWPKWKKVPNDVKNLLWDHFKTRYKWDDLTEIDMKRVWNENASNRYREMFYNARDLAMQKAYEELRCEELGTNPRMIDMVGRGPDWLDATIWDELVRNHWATADFMRKSEIARNNRMTEKDGSITKHSCGSIPYGSHKLNMQKAKDGDVDDFEVFERTHKKQATGEFVDSKSKRISDEYRAKKNCSDNSTQPSFDYFDFCEVIGGPSKGRLYGFGSSHSFDGIGSRCSSQSSIADGNDDRISELSKASEDMRAATFKMAEEAKKKEEEEGKKREEERLRLEQALEEGRKREEEGKRREDELRYMVRQMIEERKRQNRSSSGEFGPR